MRQPAIATRGDAEGSRSGDPGALAGRSAGPAWPRPAFQVIALDCEITAYAPDEGDLPLF